LDFSPDTVPSLGAHVGMCVPEGGSNIELMAPATPGAPLSEALSKFLERRGEGLYALMLEAPDPDAEAEELLARGVEVLPLMKGAGGRDIHPRSTNGVLIRVYPDDSVRKPDGVLSEEPGLSGITRVIIATSDVDAAQRAYGQGLGLAAEQPFDDDQVGLRRALVRPAKGGVIDLVAATSLDTVTAKEINRHVSEEGEGMYTLVLSADDTDAAVATLAERGVGMGGETGREFAMYGVRFMID
ncbi:MAG: VOC family protein, partial [Actinomycetota bacterium]|nr:VOC family protein [Actinomycetota bacterium]